MGHCDIEYVRDATAWNQMHENLASYAPILLVLAIDNLTQHVISPA